MTLGEMARDGGNLFLNSRDVDMLLSENPNCEKIIKPFIGAEEFIEGTKRWCLWINENEIKNFQNIKFIKDRLQKVESYRLSSRNLTTQSFQKNLTDLLKYAIKKKILYLFLKILLQIEHTCRLVMLIKIQFYLIN